MAHSTVKCNRRVKRQSGRPRAGFGSRVSFGGGSWLNFVPLDGGVGQRREVCSLWEVLSDEAISVFVEAAFPRVIRLGKVGFGSQSRDDFGMGGEFFSVVVSNR